MNPKKQEVDHQKIDQSPLDKENQEKSGNRDICDMIKHM